MQRLPTYQAQTKEVEKVKQIVGINSLQGALTAAIWQSLLSTKIIIIFIVALAIGDTHSRVAQHKTKRNTLLTQKR